MIALAVYLAGLAPFMWVSGWGIRRMHPPDHHAGRTVERGQHNRHSTSIHANQGQQRNYHSPGGGVGWRRCLLISGFQKACPSVTCTKQIFVWLVRIRLGLVKAFDVILFEHDNTLCDLFCFTPTREVSGWLSKRGTIAI